MKGPFIAASDYVRAVPEQLDPWVPGGLFVLGTDGFGRSEARRELRRFFEVDAECIAIAALSRLADDNQFDRAKIADAIRDLGHQPGESRSVCVVGAAADLLDLAPSQVGER